MQLIVLGCGSSYGTPVIGCECPTCTSTDKRNRRTRSSSAIVLDDGRVLLIDCGPDLRQQALREKLMRIDAVLCTHTHADHVHGIDDLRNFCQLQKQQIPIYGQPQAMNIIAERFGYTLREPSGHWDMPVLSINPVSDAFDVCDVTVTPILLEHGYSTIYGYRIGNMAYLTDVSKIPEESFPLLQGLDVLLLDCLRLRAHHTHINLEQSLGYAARIGAKSTYLIHMTHEIEYAALSAELPPDVRIAYDGLRLELG